MHCGFASIAQWFESKATHSVLRAVFQYKDGTGAAPNDPVPVLDNIPSDNDVHFHGTHPHLESYDTR